MTQTWHADDDTLRAWATGGAGAVLAASLEAHLLRCAECRGRVSGLASEASARDTERRWDALADEIDRPRRNPLTAVGLSTPGLRSAWLTALLVLLALPVAFSTVGDRIPVLLVLAPLAPLLAVAVAYGRGVEPAGEIALTSPSAGLRIVAARALLVGVPAVPIGVGGALLAGMPLDVALGWLLPGAALAALVLASGTTTRLDPSVVAATLGSSWAIAVGSPSAVRRVPAEVVASLVTSGPFQLVALAVALAAVALTVVRRDTVAYRRIA